jgi:FdhE protein
MDITHRTIMNQTIPLLKEIHHSFQDAAQRQPAYQELLPFFENLFEMQEAAVNDTHPEGLERSASMARSKQDAKQPILERQKLSIDIPAANRLLGVLCEAAQSASAKLSRAASMMRARSDDGRIIERGLECLGSGNPDALQALSDDLGIDKTGFVFFLYHSIWPSLARHARFYADAQVISEQWREGFCPVCGSMPNLAFLSDNGKRFLVCGFCSHHWAFTRIICPYCGNDHAETTGYFFSEEEKAYRVHTCDRCKKYIKTVDTRLLSRQFFAPLENLMTTHLDIQAEQMGYERPEDTLL